MLLISGEYSNIVFIPSKCLEKALRICRLGFSLRSQSIASGALPLPALSVRLPGFTALHPSENPLSFTLLKQVFISAAAKRHKCRTLFRSEPQNGKMTEFTAGLL